MSTQNPIIPISLQAQGIDAVIQDLQTHLDFDLSWLTNGMGQGYRLAKVRTPQNIVFLPEIYLGTTQNKYFSATPDNDKIGQSVFVIGAETLPNYQTGFFGYLEYEMSILFTANLKLIDSVLLETDDFTEHLIADVRQSIIRNLLGKAYRVTIDNIERGFENTYSDFDIANDRGISYLPLTHFRLNCTVQVKEDCPPTTLNRCAAILQNLTSNDLLNCILPTYDFSNPTTQAAVTPTQVTDLETWLCTIPIPPTSYSMDFDGVNEYIEASQSAIQELERTDSFSASCWIKRDVSGVYHTCIAKYAAIGNGRGWYFIISDVNGILIGLQSDGAVDGLALKTADNSIPINIWTHVAFAYNGNSLRSGFTVYINGVLTANTLIYDRLFNTILTPATKIAYGALIVGGLYGNCKLFECVLWNVELTGLEVLAEYNRDQMSNPPQNANVILHNRLGTESTFGTTVFTMPDVSSNSIGIQTINMEFSDRTTDVPV